MVSPNCRASPSFTVSVWPNLSTTGVSFFNTFASPYRGP